MANLALRIGGVERPEERLGPRGSAVGALPDAPGSVELTVVALAGDERRRPVVGHIREVSGASADRRHVIESIGVEPPCAVVGARERPRDHRTCCALPEERVCGQARRPSGAVVSRRGHQADAPLGQHGPTREHPARAGGRHRLEVAHSESARGRREQRDCERDGEQGPRMQIGAEPSAEARSA